MVLSLLILVCIHKLNIVYLEIYVVQIGHGFSFFGHGKSMLKKRRHPDLRLRDTKSEVANVAVSH